MGMIIAQIVAIVCVVAFLGCLVYDDYRTRRIRDREERAGKPEDG